MNGQLSKFGNIKENYLRGFEIRFSPRFFFYKPTYQIELSTPQYLLKTANNSKELVKVFELRYQNFLADTEMGETMDGFDLDEFDSVCDHLIIICKKTQDVVGTYRLMTNKMTSKFYSENEFVLDSFIKKPGIKLELGRACVEKNHRHGSVLDLLWKGLAIYAQKSGARYLFGCSSVKTVSLVKALKLRQYFEQIGHSDWVSDISVQKKFKLLPLESEVYYDENEVKEMLPPLLRTYVAAGAKVVPYPAFDQEFECMDFLTILDLENLNKGFSRRYFTF